jgi:acyl carrier protein
MTEAIALAHRKFGPIQGVVHAAGVGGASMISSQDLDEAAAIRRPKVLGSVVLAELLHATNLGTELDFFLLCSSIGAYCPGSSQGAYAAANAFQNYFARYCRKALNLPAIAIGFDVWSEVGIVADLQLPKGLEFIKEHLLRTGIDTAEGIEVIRRVLGDWREPLILVSTAELAARLAVAPQPPAAAPSEKSVAVATPQASDELTAVIEIWKDLLGNDHIQPGDNFFELGGHSLLGTMVAARLRDRFGITLTLRTLFEAATPQALAEVLRRSRMSDSDPLEPASVTDGEREEFEI